MNAESNNHFTVIRFLALLLILLALGIVFEMKVETERCSRQIYTEETTGILPLDDEFWDTYFIAHRQFVSVSSENSELQNNGKDYKNYWNTIVNTIQLCYAVSRGYNDVSDLAEAVKTLQNMRTTFETYGKFPRPAYQVYEDGWVSSMDAPAIMVASQMLYELTGNEEWSSFRDDLLEYVLKDTPSGGFNYYAAGGDIWPLEYAHTSSSAEHNYYVLNGSLVGYISLKSLAPIIMSPSLDRYLSLVEKAYFKQFSSFHTNDGNWSYYMLNPKTIIPVHYMIYEENLFRAAYYLTQNKTFYNEYLYRAFCLQKAIRIEVYERENDYEYYMLRACSPHYYLIDTNKTCLSFYDSRTNLILSDCNEITGSTGGNKEVFSLGMFSHGFIPKESKPAFIRLYSNGYETNNLLFGYPVEFSQAKSLIRVPFSVDTAFDAVISESNDSTPRCDIIKALHEKEEGDVILAFRYAQELGDKFYAIEINNLSEYTTSLGLILYDSSGNSATRYYTRLLPGKNCVVFDERGFSGFESLKNIESVWLRIYDDEVNDEKFSVEIGNVYQFSSIASFYEYILNSEYEINPQ